MLDKVSPCFGPRFNVERERGRLMKTDLGKFDIDSISFNSAIFIAVAGVADQLRIPDTKITLAGLARREDGDGRSSKRSSNQ